MATLKEMLETPNLTMGLYGDDRDIEDFVGVVSYLYNTGFNISGSKQIPGKTVQCVTSVSFDVWKGIRWACDLNGCDYSSARNALIPLPKYVFTGADSYYLQKYSREGFGSKRILIVDCRGENFDTIISGLMRYLTKRENHSYAFLFKESELKTRSTNAELDVIVKLERNSAGIVTYLEKDIKDFRQDTKEKSFEYEYNSF